MTEPLGTPKKRKGLSEERRCTANSKRSGERCKRPPMIGAKTCATHGSANRVSRAAAERRVVEAEAGALVRKLLADPNAAPVDNPVVELMRIAGRMGHAVDVLGERVNEIDEAGRMEYTDANLVRRLHVIVEAWERVMSEYRRTLTDMARLGIEERHVKLQEQQGALLAAVITRVLDRLELTPAQRSLVGTVVPEELMAIAGGESR